MNNSKEEIINKICFTDLVYGRINKKLKTNFSRNEIEKMIDEVLRDTEETYFIKTGKNFYITNSDRNIRITINSFTFRVITVDDLTKRHKSSAKPQ